MPDAFEEQAVLVAAEQAAAEGDAIAAELHLRRLLDLQTARLGPEHAEVASTLHNLAVVCERASRVSEAEGLYRKAYAVAAAVLPPTDQLVIRCLDDLNAFLDARTMPRQPPIAPTAAAPVPTARAAASPASGVRRTSPPGTTRMPARPPSRVRPPAPVPPPARSPTLWTGLAIAGGVILASGIVWLLVGRSAVAPAPVTAEVAAPVPAKRPAPAPKKTAPPAPAATAAPAAAAPPAIAPGTAPAPAPIVEPPPPPAEPTGPVAAESPAAADGRSAEITVTDARLCAQLSTEAGWTCTAPDVPFGGGRLYFLTRIDVPETTQVEHRWLHAGDVIQAVRLRIQPAGRPGYRTYSRQTIDPARSGEWRIELRGPDGAVLAEERIVVQ